MIVEGVNPNLPIAPGNPPRYTVFHKGGGRPRWVKTDEDKDYIVHWIAVGLPRRVVLELCEERGIKVPGGPIGMKLAKLSSFAKSHADEVKEARRAISVSARSDAEGRREDFLDHCYTTRDMIYERMIHDRDAGGRAHLVRECREYDALISQVEGFDRRPLDPRTRRAVDHLIESMFGARPAIEGEVTVLDAPS